MIHKAKLSSGPTYVVEGHNGGPMTTQQVADGYNYPALVPLAGDAVTYLERRGVYGPSEVGFGVVMMALFPDGLRLRSQADWVRYGLLHNVVAKLVRYCNNFTTGGHADSLRDIRVYAAMLQAEDGP